MSDAITGADSVTTQMPVAPGQTSDSSVTGDSPSVTDKASQVASSAKESGAEVAQTAADQAKHVAAETQRQARNLVGEARDQVREQAQTQQQRASSSLHSLAEQFGTMADSGDESSTATELARQASDRAHGLASWLEQRQPGDLLDEVRRFARQRPGVFLFAAAAAGAVAGRLTRGVVAAQSDEKSAQTNYPRGGTDVSQFMSGRPIASSDAEYPAYPPEPGYGAGYTPSGPLGAAPPVAPYPTAPGELAQEHVPIPTQPSTYGTTPFTTPTTYGSDPNPYGPGPETEGRS